MTQGMGLTLEENLPRGSSAPASVGRDGAVPGWEVPLQPPPSCPLSLLSGAAGAQESEWPRQYFGFSPAFAEVSAIASFFPHHDSVMFL